METITLQAKKHLAGWRGISFKGFVSFFTHSIKIPVIILAVLLVIFGFLLVNYISNAFFTNPVSMQVSLQNAKAGMNINKVFSFPIKDMDGKELSSLKYEILNAELRDQIIVKGETATAVKGRTFLILNLKLTNAYDKSIQINARDFIRLIVNNSSERLAPEIHNDPVDAQAISTKYTRLGFTIDDSQRNLKLEVGEISGKKEIINLKLK